MDVVMMNVGATRWRLFDGVYQRPLRAMITCFVEEKWLTWDEHFES